jgi:integrase
MIKQNVRPASQAQIEEISSMSTAEIRKILEACEREPKLHVVGEVVRVITNTGLRGSEFKRLQMSEIDIPSGGVTISKGPKVPYARKPILRPKTIDAVAAFHKLNPKVALVLGESSHRRMADCKARLRLAWRQLSPSSLLLLRVRMNFIYRPMSGGIPEWFGKCCPAHPSLTAKYYMSPTSEERLETARRIWIGF